MAKSRSIGSIYASLTLRDGGFRSGLKSASKALGTFAVAGVGAAVVGVGALSTALAAGAKNTMEMAGTLDDLSATTGLAIADAMKLRKAFELGGLEAGNAGTSIGKMQKALVAAAKGDADPFKEIGLSAQELLKLSPAEQFRMIGDAIMRIENPAERTAKAMEIFGKSGAGLTNVFGQFKEADKFLGKMPELFESYATAMARADDLINEMPNKSQQFFTGFTAGIIGEVLPQLEKVNNFDFSEIGKSIGENLSAGFRGVMDGSLWGIFLDKGMAACLRVSEALGNGLRAQFETLGAFIDHLSKKLGSSEFGNGFTAHLNTIFDGLVMPYKGEKFNYQERLAHYYNGKGEDPGEFDYAGVLAQKYSDGPKYLSEKAEELDKRAAETFKLLKDEVSEGLKAARDMGIEAKQEREHPADPIRNLSEQALVATDAARMAVNDYQRRGLSLGGGQAGLKQDKQITLLSSIDGTLKKMNRPGEKTTF